MKSKKKKSKKRVSQKKRKLKDYDDDSDSTVISSVIISEGNTSSDVSSDDLLSDPKDWQDDLEESPAARMKELKQKRDETGDTSGSHDEISAGGTEGVTSNNAAIDDADVDKYVAVYFSHPKPHYFWGKIVKLFSNDEEADVTQVEVEFLKKKISSDPSAWTWAEKAIKEALIVETKFIVFGPLLPDVKKNVFLFPDVLAMASLQEFKERED